MKTLSPSKKLIEILSGLSSPEVKIAMFAALFDGMTIKIVNKQGETLGHISDVNVRPISSGFATVKDNLSFKITRAGIAYKAILISPVKDVTIEKMAADLFASYADRVMGKGAVITIDDTAVGMNKKDLEP